jgi:tetratricopeptide (TPR) repeat protein
MPRPALLVIGAGLIVAVGAIAVLRGGVLGLPSAPRDVTATQAGLADLEGLRARAVALEAGAAGTARISDPDLATAAQGVSLARGADPEQGVLLLRQAFEHAPRDLVIGNAFRMETFHLKRRFAQDATRGATETERLPAWLAHEPLATLERMERAGAPREVTLQHALAWADEIVLFPALEIQAPANVESVKLLTALLEREPAYVPALYGRGLGYLHRPARLVWPEARKAAPDAASHDLGLAVAVGSKVGGASARLRGTLALTLGDAYAKEGRADRARSWWQIAENSDPALREAVRRRLSLPNDGLLDGVAALLTERLRDTDHPLTDLAVMWR